MSNELTLKEAWRPVLAWEEYEVSDLGNVRSPRGPIKTFPVGDYPAFNVCRGRYVRKSLRVHVEVAKAFLGDFSPSKIVLHWDGNPRNCALSNLRWGTYLENEADKKRHGRTMLGEKHCRAVLSTAAVHHIKESQQSGVSLARIYGVTPTAICDVRKGRCRRAS